MAGATFAGEEECPRPPSPDSDFLSASSEKAAGGYIAPRCGSAFQQLPLIFMDALDLAIEDGVGVNGLARCGLEPGGKAGFRITLCIPEAVAKSFIVGERLQLAFKWLRSVTQLSPGSPG